jgi:uncharacterized iron-regulated protein
MLRYLFLLLVSFSPIYLWAQQTSINYKIYSTALHKEVSLDDIVQATAQGSILAYGEQHDDAITHQLQYEILSKLYARHQQKVVLALEMFHTDVQHIINEYMNGIISEKNFIKEARSWDSYKTDYSACVNFCKDNKLNVIAANTPSRYANRVTRLGLESLNELDKKIKKAFLPPLPIDTFQGTYYDKFLEAMGGHTVPGMNLYQTQNLWDATMAWSINNILKNDKSAVVYMLNGRFHSDEHLGYVKRLEDQYKRKVVNISSFYTDNIDQPDWKSYEKLGDYIIVTLAQKKEEKK